MRDYAFGSAQDAGSWTTRLTTTKNYGKSRGCFWNHLPDGSTDATALADVDRNIAGSASRATTTALLNQVFLGPYRKPDSKSNAGNGFVAEGRLERPPSSTA